MQSQAFIRQLHTWHEAEEHEEILRAIDRIPREAWSYALAGLYARALNNLERYREALALLLSLEAEGKNDGMWHYRIGYSLYYLNREAEAAARFERAIALGDDGDDTREMLRLSLLFARMKDNFKREKDRG